ncbi:MULTISPECIES: S-adenosylmethionine:tRNA ribosyltransferase-isomerase [Reichenbachiella]|uniref:S-adenosylmethionine:tRNA ribosyltransferase-isomerase n=1 Tax=Reichenbachiella TaxID=156993 RepID=UPI000E6CD469|nr:MULTISPECIES: S-adenosylmethionine:tRNA ribosyltransferase-isomerase [Reichenbachiella]MBU2912858.1 S-adenosylmethionine:tRNA ribosyltransferase-isomerase [Reichenbachiella agariperforans]RJE70634.1 S-adenosylmethionine tRNA ribosyltransferase [Reichenbachiella sp. MSK19-1]
MVNNNTDLAQYLFDLPDEKIAKHPLKDRDASKLLVYKNDTIHHDHFRNLLDHVPTDATLFLNNTKVIAARLYFQKNTGAKIEVFLTEPISPHTAFEPALKAKKTCIWKCMIGNLKKWKDNTSIYLTLGAINLEAKLLDRSHCLVEFSWDTADEFLMVIEAAGHVPLPPYLNRAQESEDKYRYQTVFSEKEGAVAAPTAGLHFTDSILDTIRSKGHVVDQLTLHVSAGTFRPIKTEDFTEHDMHNERIIIYRHNLINILESKGPIVAVGTTAMRTLESTYWYGALLSKELTKDFKVDQHTAYREELAGISLETAIQAIIHQMDQLGIDELHGETEIFIYPGYDFKVVQGLFTNFHMPSSTLVLLVAAFVGSDWRKIYNEALSHDYRFLSYGDSSLLLR